MQWETARLGSWFNLMWCSLDPNNHILVENRLKVLDKMRKEKAVGRWLRKSVLCSEGYPGLLGLGLGPGQLHIHPPGVETQHYARHTTICYPIHIVKLSSILPMIMKLEISGTQQLTKSPPYSSPTKTSVQNICSFPSSATQWKAWLGCKRGRSLVNQYMCNQCA